MRNRNPEPSQERNLKLHAGSVPSPSLAFTQGLYPLLATNYKPSLRRVVAF